MEDTESKRVKPPKEEVIKALEETLSEPESLPPGTKYFETNADGSKVRKKVRWKMEDIMRLYPQKVPVYPSETLTLTWNGVSVRIYEGVETEIPKPHADLYNERLRNIQKMKNQSLLIVEGQPVHVMSNAGGL